jgi:hypothetical protein
VEFNHKKGFANPSLFLLGFRAIFYTTSGDSNDKSYKKLVSSAIQLANY